jgi:hypothetical protein
MRRHIPLSFLLVLFVTLGCEDSPGPTTPILPQGATISGSIVNSGLGVPTSSSGAVVRVLGSNLSSIVDVNQSFTITGVSPASNVTLEFSGTGLSSQIPIGAVQQGDQVVLTLARTNSVLTVDTRGRQGSGSTEVAGRVDSINGATNSFVVGGQTIQTNPATQFIGASGAIGTFADLNVGLRVTVTGTTTSPTSILATVVRAETTIPDTPVTLTGTISDLSGTASSFQFTLDGRVIRGDTSTIFDAGRSFSNLQNGGLVQVNGTNKVGFVQASRIQIL